MSQYLCPDCGEDSQVIETRPSYNRLRRRRKCNGKKAHRFSTIEVPLNGPARIEGLIRFALENTYPDDSEDMRQDMLEYVKSEAHEILLGLSEQTPPEERI